MLDAKTLWNFYTTARSGIIRLLRGSMAEKYAQEHKMILLGYIGRLNILAIIMLIVIMAR